jgi:hypothetical protein
MTAHIQLTVVDRRRGYVDASVTPKPGTQAHRIGYLRGEGWWCHTCDSSNSRGKRCRLIQLVQQHPDVPNMEGSMPILLGPADPDHYRTKIGRYRDRWYVDPLPADQIADATDEAWPSVSTVKGAYGKNWEYVGYKRIADWLQDRPHELDGLNHHDRYERIKQMAKSSLKVAASRGTDVHTMFENRLRNRVTDDRMLSEEARAYRPAVDAFFDDHQPELFAAELVCINRGMHDVGYGGTADAIIRLQGSLLLPDWKSRGKDSDHGAYPEEVAQLGGYNGADYIITEGPKRTALPPLDGGLIVSIRPDGYRIFPVDLGEAWLQFEGLHAWWARRLDEQKAIGRPWPPRGQVDLFALIASCENDRQAYEALWEAHRAAWTPEATAAVKARLQGAQPHLTAVR